MHRDERRIARFYQFVVLVRRKIDIERHQAVVQKRINRPPRLNGELRVQLYRILQIAQALLEHRRHLFQPRRRGERALARCVVLLFQERKNAGDAFADVDLRICPFELEHAILKIDVLQLRPKENRVDALVLRPIIDLHRPNFLEQRANILGELRDFGR